MNIDSMCIDNDYFDMSPLMDALQSDTWCQFQCFLQNTYRIIEWISRRHHSYPKTRKGWYNTIANQFCYHYTAQGAGATHIPYDPQYMIEWLLLNGILRPGFSRMLKLTGRIPTQLIRPI